LLECVLTSDTLTTEKRKVHVLVLEKDP
jgi:hypothetical protein